MMLVQVRKLSLRRGEETSVADGDDGKDFRRHC